MSSSSKDQEFLAQYFTKFADGVLNSKEVIDELIMVKTELVEASMRSRKTVVIGNGGSAATASHLSLDLTNACKLRSINFNEPSLITCFANDHGYDQWLTKSIQAYGDEGDVLIAISSSGQSKNILNACSEARERKFKSVITLSGFKADNPLRSMGDINLWIDSHHYNFVEMMHQFWVLSIVDLLV